MIFFLLLDYPELTASNDTSLWAGKNSEKIVYLSLLPTMFKKERPRGVSEPKRNAK
jgi:hypothetical protein